MPTLVESGHRLHWTKISEDGQGEDRLITFAMSSLISYYCSAFCSAFIFKTVQRTVRKVFFKSRQNATFWSKVGKTGVG